MGGGRTKFGGRNTLDILHVSATDKTLRKAGKLMLSSAPGSLCAPIHSRPQDLAAKWARRSSHVAKGPKQKTKNLRHSGNPGTSPKDPPQL